MYPHLRSLVMGKWLLLAALAFGLLLSGPKTASAAGEFITTWQTTSPSESITIPTTGGGYNYDVDWGDSNTDTGTTTSATHVYAAAGTYTVTISGTFPRIYFNDAGDKNKILSVEQWGTGTWTSMNGAFYGASNLSVNALDAPDLSSVTDMSHMFHGATSLNQNIGGWNVSNVTDMSALFYGANTFNQNIGSWDVSNVTNLNSIFTAATAFNQNIGGWNVSNVTNMGHVFEGASNFNQDISSWVVSSATDMSLMFINDTAFNQDISSWNVSNVTNMALMFYGASSFNQNIGSWNVSSVTNMNAMFQNANAFNQDISGWNVISVTNMDSMFAYNPGFNGPLNGWGSKVGNVTNMSSMFAGTTFNQPLDSWVPSSTLNFSNMFYGATSFNQDISSWDVSSATNMNSMFYGATSFNRDISDWDVSSVTDMTDMFDGVRLSTTYYNALLRGWSALPLQSGVVFDGGTSLYSPSVTERAGIITDFGWTITDGGTSGEFMMTWITTSTSESITVPTVGGGYNYTVDWGDSSSTVGITGDATHVYTATGTHTVAISGTFPRIYFNGSGDSGKILSVEQWGNNPWTSMSGAFMGTANLVVNAPDEPDLSAVADMSSMFRNATSFNQDISGWDVSNATNTSSLFRGASSFNQPLNAWNVSNVVDMSGMFNNASAFNQSLNTWTVSSTLDMSSMFGGAAAFNGALNGWGSSTLNVTNMSAMFSGANIFNRPLHNWDVSSVTNMSDMFSYAPGFNQPLDSWDVSNVTDMQYMFYSAYAFDQSLASWDVSNVTNMNSMFMFTYAFNQPLSTWNVSSVTNMSGLFNTATAFNQSLSSWDVSGVTDMSVMFNGAALFNQNIGGWDVSSVTDMTDMLAGVTLSTPNYNALLAGWSGQILQSGVTFSGGDSLYSTSTAMRQSIIDDYSWTITDGGPMDSYTVTYIAGSNGSLTGSTTQLVYEGYDGSAVTAVPGSGYSFTSWSDASSTNPRTDTNVTSDHTFTASFTLIPVVSSGGGGGGGGALTSTGGALPTLFPYLFTQPPSTTIPPPIEAQPVTPPSTNTPPVIVVTQPHAPIAIVALLKEDARAFRITLSEADLERLAAFIEQGTSQESIALGSGERRAAIRDIFDTIGRAIPTSDIEKLIRGETAPGSRNLDREKEQLQRTRLTFRTIYGRDPNFKNAQENKAWNTLMYRIRFSRDLNAEKKGIQAFKVLFKKDPKDPFQWAAVRSLGYIER